ncbi:hypothetical protein [Undibacterium sp. TC9W]|uniref:hypothetical protein n=1 Tax=Undibacterium sp. TC9W TaxID=3413053 RepID=UPI003BF0003D
MLGQNIPGKNVVKCSEMPIRLKFDHHALQHQQIVATMKEQVVVMAMACAASTYQSVFPNWKNIPYKQVMYATNIGFGYSRGTI